MSGALCLTLLRALEVHRIYAQTNNKGGRLIAYTASVNKPWHAWATPTPRDDWQEADRALMQCSMTIE
jgi:hypothetical protein